MNKPILWVMVSKERWKKRFGEYKYQMLLDFHECDKARWDKMRCNADLETSDSIVYLKLSEMRLECCKCDQISDGEWVNERIVRVYGQH